MGVEHIGAGVPLDAQSKYLGELQNRLAMCAYRVIHREEPMSEEDPRANNKNIKTEARALWDVEYAAVFRGFAEKHPNDLPDLDDHHMISILFDSLYARKHAPENPSMGYLDKNLSI